MPERSDVPHQIATTAAMQMIKQGVEAGLSWEQIAVSSETFLAIVISATVKMADTSPKGQTIAQRTEFATELVNMITERAHVRVTSLILGVPYEG